MRRMSDVGITSDVLPKKSRKSYKEPDVDEFDDDDEDEDEEEVADSKPADVKGDDGEDDEDLEEDEYVVEKIFEHYIANDEYYESIGGKEKIFEQTKKALNGRKRQRQSKSATPVETTKAAKKQKSHPLDSTPPASAKAAEWKPPSGSWEDHVETVDMCQDENDGTFIVYLTWKNGKKTQHPKEVIYRRCPQKMLRFYERHIRISRDGGETVPIGSMTH
ncbi:hypothetical protein N0V82_004213 [Gnomoniopsis sp. IMI 355080]|nr:hypothetical protein N0V82_004213 [Gnomoniopsis sp. IMI 355080]